MFLLNQNAKEETLFIFSWQAFCERGWISLLLPSIESYLIWYIPSYIDEFSCCYESGNYQALNSYMVSLQYSQVTHCISQDGKNCKKDFKQFSCWYDKLSSFRALQGQPEQDLSSCTSHLARWINCKKFNGIWKETEQRGLEKPTELNFVLYLNANRRVDQNDES